MFVDILTILLYGSIAIWFVRGAWTMWRRRGAWRRLLFWIAGAIAFYAGLIWLINGPGAGYLNGLTADALFAAIVAVVPPLLLGLMELIFSAKDGPLPNVKAGRVHRRKLYRWMAAAAALVAVLALAVRIGPESWHEKLLIVTFVTVVFCGLMLWFEHYKARRFDYGTAAAPLNAWVHWEYLHGELEAFDGLDPNGPRETWMGPAGLLYAGDYAPWKLSIYQLVRADCTLSAPPRVNFTFKKTGLGNVTSEDVMRVAIPQGREGDLESIERELRALCPTAKIQLR